MSQGDFFTKIGIKRFVFVGHGNPDRDVVASMYMWCSCLGLDWRDGRIIYEFVHSGNCLEDDSVIHPVSNERIELDNSVLVIHFDTGMCRLGIQEKDIKEVLKLKSQIDKFKEVIIMSHLACAGEKKDPFNEIQRKDLFFHLHKLSDS